MAGEVRASDPAGELFDLVSTAAVVEHGEQDIFERVLRQMVNVYDINETTSCFFLQAAPVGGDSPKPASRPKVSRKVESIRYRTNYNVLRALFYVN